MSDLAPFVAATLRDKTIADLQEENRQLRERLQDLEPWTIRIQNHDGSVVYAIAKLGVKELMQQMRCDTRPDVSLEEMTIRVPMETVVGSRPCRMSEFLQGTIVLNTTKGSESEFMGMPSADILHGIKATEDGNFELGWYFSRPEQGGIAAVLVHVPIPADRLSLVTPELSEGMGIAREPALQVAYDVTNDGPISFTTVYLVARGLLCLFHDGKTYVDSRE